MTHNSDLVKVETVVGKNLNPGDTVFIGGVWRKLVEVDKVK